MQRDVAALRETPAELAVDLDYAREHRSPRAPLAGLGFRGDENAPRLVKNRRSAGQPLDCACLGQSNDVAVRTELIREDAFGLHWL